MKGSKSKTQFLILGLLSEQPLTGYDIKKIVDIRFSNFWSESYGQIYPELAKLESSGLVTVSRQNTGTKKERKQYSITESGLSALKEWLAQPVEKEIVRFELLLKLYFSNLTQTEVITDHIKDFYKFHKQQLSLFEQFKNEIEKVMDLHDNHQQVLMVIDFGEKVSQAYTDWCEDVLERLKDQKR
jgi:DNA-binding PadR family transcriptional regulator